MGEELCHLDDVRVKMRFTPYWKAFSHNLALLHPSSVQELNVTEVCSIQTHVHFVFVYYLKKYTF